MKDQEFKPSMISYQNDSINNIKQKKKRSQILSTLQFFSIIFIVGLIIMEQNFFSFRTNEHQIKKIPLTIEKSSQQIMNQKNVFDVHNFVPMIKKEMSLSQQQRKGGNACPSSGIQIIFPYFCISSFPFAVLFLGVYDSDINFIEDASGIVGLGLYKTDKQFQIPTYLTKLSNLFLFAAYGSLTGTIPSEFGLMSKLNFCTMIRNTHLKTTIPSEMGLLSILTYLQLSDSELMGSIPSELFELQSLTKISLDYTNIAGVLRSEIGMIRNLTILYIDGTQVSGTIPTQIGNINLLSFTIRQNYFSGLIPSEIGKLSDLQLLLVSENLFTGTLPSQLGLIKNIEQFNFSSNYFSGSIPTEFSSLKMILSLEFQNNLLNGSIPSQIGILSTLKILRFDSNKLTGTLPSQLGLLQQVVLLNISYNSLNGTIPQEILSNKNMNILCDYSGISANICRFSSQNSKSEFLPINILISVICLISIQMICIFIAAILTFHYRFTEVIRTTNYRFGIVSLMGLLILSSSVIPFGLTLIEDISFEQKKIACQIYPHLLVHGLLIVLTGIIIRNYPIWRVFDNPTLQIIVVRPSMLLKVVLFALIVSIAIVTPFSVGLEPKIANFGCEIVNPGSSYLLIVIACYLMSLAFLACWMCFKIRKVAAIYNNTGDVAMATYNLFTFGMAMVVIGLVATNPTTLFLAIFFSICVSVSTFTALVHVKKIWSALFPRHISASKVISPYFHSSSLLTKYSGKSTSSAQKLKIAQNTK